MNASKIKDDLKSINNPDIVFKENKIVPTKTFEDPKTNSPSAQRYQMPHTIHNNFTDTEIEENINVIKSIE